MLLFQTRVAVPSHMIEEIGNEIKDLVVKNMMLQQQSYKAFTKEEIAVVDQLLQSSIQALVISNHKSCDGWRLDKDAALDIAHYMGHDERVRAVKRFREFTGAGLKEAVRLIDQFGCTEAGALEFLSAFI